MPAFSRKKLKYEYVKHTADIEFFAYGKTLGELFRNASMAMFNTIADTRAIASLPSKTKIFRVAVSSHAPEDLLWKFLQRTFSIADSNYAFSYKVKAVSVKVGKERCSAKATVCSKSSSSGVSMLDVKGVSKYDLHLTGAKGAFKASVVLDV
jgi:SHS2 domain-containing protein